MANSEHLSILDRGTDSWNKWREQNASIWPDLSDAILLEKHNALMAKKAEELRTRHIKDYLVV